MKSDLVDLRLEVFDETPRAYKVRNMKDAYVFLAKSQVELDPPWTRRGTYTVTLPAWLAEEKELS